LSSVFFVILFGGAGFMFYLLVQEQKSEIRGIKIISTNEEVRIYDIKHQYKLGDTLLIGKELTNTLYHPIYDKLSNKDTIIYETLIKKAVVIKVGK